jgi:SAM-dependent methyltransferase
MMMTNNDWYRYYATRRVAGLTPEGVAQGCAEAARDLDAVLARTGLRPGDRILEVGCGWGRHGLELAQRGFQHVISVDIAAEPIAIAQALAAEMGLRCDFRQQDFATLEAPPFQAILSLYDRSVCGFPTEAEDQRSLRHLASLLASGGWLVFGINDWPFQLPPPSRDWVETADGIELIEVRPDHAAMTCTHHVTLVRLDGRREIYALTRRHYYLPELRRLLTGAGFELVAASHRLAGERPYGDGGDGLFVYARRV